MEDAVQLLEQFTTWVSSLAQENLAIALVAVLGFATLGGPLLAILLKLLRALLPWLVLAGAIALCWYTGLLDRCWSWLTSLR